MTIGLNTGVFPVVFKVVLIRKGSYNPQNGIARVCVKSQAGRLFGMISDINGLEVDKGDMVAPLTGDFRGRVSAVKLEDGEGFVCIRPSHRPYSKGVWYAAEHVQRLQKAKVPDEAKDDKDAKGVKNGKDSTDAKAGSKSKAASG